MGTARAYLLWSGDVVPQTIRGAVFSGHVASIRILEHPYMSVFPPAPDGFVACRTTRKGATLTHLVALDEHGSNGGRPTVCGLTRFDDRDSQGRAIPGTAGLPGWGLGDSGVTGPRVEQIKCVACFRQAERPAQSARLRVIEQGSDVLVLGTDQIVQAAQFAGLSNAEGVYWGSSHPGLFVRRNGKWVGRSAFQPPKDTRRGVLFVSVHYETKKFRRAE